MPYSYLFYGWKSGIFLIMLEVCFREVIMNQKLTFQTDEDITVFMEQHDGFELVDQVLAEVIATPPFYKKGQINICVRELG